MRTIVAALFVVVSTSLFAADMPTGQPDWMKYSNPAAEHKALNDFAGKWKFTMTFWMENNGKAEKSTGTSNSKWVLGGRFLQQDVKSTTNGQKFEGLGFTGYDLLKKEYQTVWMDSMTTSMMLGAGTQEGNTLTTKGTMSCGMTENPNRPYRTELVKISKNEHTFTMFSNDKEGKEFKTMEINYKRAN